MEAGDYARFESAAEHLDEVGAQFEHGQRFTEGMKIELLDRDPLTAFREQLRQKLGDVGRFELLPWGLTDTTAQVIRTLGGGRGLEKTIRALDTILDQGFAPVRSRMERWVSELEASAAAARDESVVLYQEGDGQRALKAYHTRDLRLQQAVA